MKRIYARQLIQVFYVSMSVLILLTVNACEKEYSCEDYLLINMPPDTAITDSTLYTGFTIDGQRFFNISGKSDYYFAWDSHYFFLSNTAGINQLTTQRDFFVFDPSGPDIKLQRIAFYAPGNYNYTGMQNPGDNGIRIFFTDQSGKIWQTDLGIADQTNSSFVIISQTIIRNLTNNVITGMLFEATFNCTLYDGTGNSKKLMNGRCRYYLWL